METSPKILEEKLHRIWLNQEFAKSLITKNNEKIVVLNPGNYNNDSAGPDFKHARIQIGNLTFVGDVEIDYDYSNWKTHGHNINKRYNKVILHVTYLNKQKHHYIYTSEGRKVPTIALIDFVEDGLIDNLLEQKHYKKNLNKIILKCASEIDTIDLEERRKFILKLGFNRFQKKSSRIFRRLKELKFLKELQLKEPVIRYELTKAFAEKEFTHQDFNDTSLWEQVLYELVFEALGYSKNKNMMLKLAQNLDLEFLKKIENDSELKLKLEALYFGVAGLLPETEGLTKDQISEHVYELNEQWNKLKLLYDNKLFDETQWHFLGQRPQNFPTVRIIGGMKIANDILHNNLTGKIIKKFLEINDTKVLINSVRSLFIIKSGGYWKTHYIFEKLAKTEIKYFIGVSRADEIFINILLPFLSVYFDMFGNEASSKKVLKVYNDYEQRMDNKIVRDVAENLQLFGLNKKTIYMQGMIEVYRKLCSRNKCLECEIGKQVFQ